MCFKFYFSLSNFNLCVFNFKFYHTRLDSVFCLLSNLLRSELMSTLYIDITIYAKGSSTIENSTDKQYVTETFPRITISTVGLNSWTTFLVLTSCSELSLTFNRWFSIIIRFLSKCTEKCFSLSLYFCAGSLHIISSYFVDFISDFTTNDYNYFCGNKYVLENAIA